MTTLATELTAELCVATPNVQVLDNRGLVVRSLQYNRPAIGAAAQLLRTQQHYHARGVLLSSLDPRLGAAQQADPDLAPNFRYQASLSARVLRTQGVDSGQQVTLFDIEGGPLWQQGSRGQLRRWRYDRLHRVTALAEQASPAANERISEQFQYGEGRAGAVAANARGQLVAHYDTAGLNQIPCYNRSAQPLLTVRQLLRDPAAESDWQGAPADWPAQLEATRYESRQRYNALGAAIGSVDAKGHQQQQRLNIAGQLASSALILADGTPHALLSAIHYSAAGQVQQETAGNGVVSDYTYEAPTQRLSRLRTTRPPGSGRSTLLQDLNYSYDPVGNILAIDDAAQAVHYHKNRRIVATNDYQYDALYQLTQASGRENASNGIQGPGLPAPQVPLSVDPQAFSPYSRNYTYDDGGNLTQIRHHGAQSYTLEMLVSPTSNRAVQQTGFLLPSDVEGYFDAGGNLLQLAPGQPLEWDGRNQLQRVAQVARTAGADDAETYQYDGGGQRIRKSTLSHTSSTRRTAQVLYLPGLELRLTQSELNGTLSTVEDLQVIQTGASGRQSMRLLHWDSGQPAEIPNDQVRYSLDNQIGSSLLELDQQADILTLEEYFPFGGTAVWSGKTQSETQYKFVRYSGKERDATGLYYYGFRYYAPWLGRWLNPDPAGTVDGLNLFRMVGNNPVSYVDDNGLMFKSLSSMSSSRRDRNRPGEVPPVSDSVGSAEYSSQSQLNARLSKNEQVIKIAERLVDIVETGRGGMRTLQGEQFNDTMTKLAAFYIDLQPEGTLSDGKKIMQHSKGFRRPPKYLVNQARERGSLYDFLTPYLTRSQGSENFCLQNVTSDLHKWVAHMIDKQQKRLPSGKASELLMRMSRAADPEITRAEFTQNPASRPPEDQEEAIQYIHYMAGQFESESEWINLARDMYTDEYHLLKNVTYDKARRAFDKNKASGMYKN